MRTIAVYSYKGGNGKSLIAANLAVCLSRLGKNCILVDWDVEAPSAHLKLGVSQASGGGGLVGLIRDCLRPQVKERDWINTQIELKDVEFFDEKDSLRIADVDRYVYELDDIRDREAIQKSPDYGHIYLLPAGDTRKELYWDTTWSPLWREMFTIEYAASRRPELVEVRDRVFKFLREIKAKLSALSGPGEIEYLILDCRSGSSDLTMTLTSAWLEDPLTDRMVYCLTFNKESINYLDRFARQIRDPQLREMMVPVLCRVPTSFEYHKGDETLREALSKLDKRPQDLFFLHSDRKLEAYERLRLGLNAKPDETTLTTEYVRLFEKLLDPILWSGSSTLAQRLGLPDRGIEDKERIFDWDPATGALVNPNDDSRNVSFKVETFQMFLAGLEAGLGNAPDVREQLPKLLFAAGEQCGARFGRVMLERFATEDDAGGIMARIEKWCKFDSDVGFGSFGLVRKSVTMDNGILVACDVLLRQSFLTPAEVEKPVFDEQTKTYSALQDHRFCAFMQGYIRGVLVQLLNDKYLEVGHREQKRTLTEKSDSCIFTIKHSGGRQSFKRE